MSGHLSLALITLLSPTVFFRLWPNNWLALWVSSSFCPQRQPWFLVGLGFVQKGWYAPGQPFLFFSVQLDKSTETNASCFLRYALVESIARTGHLVPRVSANHLSCAGWLFSVGWMGSNPATPNLSPSAMSILRFSFSWFVDNTLSRVTSSFWPAWGLLPGSFMGTAIKSALESYVGWWETKLRLVKGLGVGFVKQCFVFEDFKKCISSHVIWASRNFWGHR